MGYHDLKKYQEAIEDYKEAIRLNPQYSNAYYNRANTYCCLQDNEQAIKDYSKAISLNPQNATAYNNRGASYHDLEKYQEALNIIQKLFVLILTT